MGATEANELELYVNNEASLYPQKKAIQKNLATKKVRSQYKHDLAVKLFGYLVESGAKKYVKEFGSPGHPWHKMFDVPTRKLVAEELTREFEVEFELGNYDNLLPKKYQKELAKQHLVPPHPHHARKKVTWRVPEGIEVVWSPVNQAYLALWPAKRRRADQQVLKIAGTDAMHDWLRETYGASHGHSQDKRSSTSQPTKSHSAVSRAHGSSLVAGRARKKSPSQLQREIDAALGRRRNR